ncbi:MAG: GNAT family N-acetyltransferase [Anaerolineae bacterium]|nr:GNAT family N-acetyltransferase [Anaerolineae bacterium]
MMSIRRATIDDAELLARMNEAVQQIHHDARPDLFKSYTFAPELVTIYQSRLADDSLYGFVAEVDGEPVGYLLAQVVERADNPYTVAIRALSVDEMSVNPAFRSYGYGEALMDAVFSLARSLGIRRVLLNVWAFNERAIAFYERQGFKPRDIRMEAILE